jgi:UDP-N-acetyl-D-mannosaminuronic acid dehydrogenase
MKNTKNIVIIGGCGHVGLPLGIALAECSFKVSLLDINHKYIDLVNSGQLPFVEQKNVDLILKKLIRLNKLKATDDASVISSANIVIFVTGTPVDEHLNPRVNDITKVIELYFPYLKSDQLIILRSTVYPDVIELVDCMLEKKLGKHKLAFCPERVTQGNGLNEIKTLPQIVSATSTIAEQEAVALFSKITTKTIILTTLEAGLAKLITNSWRYLEFAIANQFYMMIEAQQLDFFKIYNAIKEDYPRAKNFVTPGLTAGPCLFKDTMQLSAFHKNNFFLGHSAMLVNEGLPTFLVEQLENKLGTLKNKKIAILGMSFKADNDDIRESLSYKIKKLLEAKLTIVLMTDVYNNKLFPLKKALKQADGIILGAPHKEYLKLKITKPYVDCWGVWRKRK